jgi:hypothetical protein
MFEFTESETISGVKISEYTGISVGYITLPIDVSRDKYITHCCLNNKLNVFDNILKTNLKDVFISDQLLNDIQFPEKSGKFGTAVIIGYLSYVGKAVCIGTLNNKTEYNNINPNSFKFSKNFNGNIVEIFGDAETGQLFINTSGGNSATNLKINVSGANDSELNINVLGKTKIFSSKSTEISDSFGNSISLTENGVVLSKTKEENKIFLGSTDADKSSVIGEELKTILDDILSAITKMTVTCPPSGGPSKPPVNIADFVEIQTKLDTILSKNVMLK